MTSTKKTASTELTETTRELDALESRLQIEEDPTQQALLIEEIGDTKALLAHLTYEGGRGGEDFVNDSAFHADRR